MNVRSDPDGVPSGLCRGSAVAILIATALVLLTVGVGTAVADGPEYSARPETDMTSDEPRGSFSYALEIGGGRVVDAVEIMNFSEDPGRFDVYAADMVQTSAGGLAPASRDAEVVDAGAWIIPDTEMIEVAARSSELVHFTIEIPAGTAPGEYVAALLVERQESEGAGTIETRTRIGLRVEIEVLGEIDLGVSLEDVDWSRARRDVSFSLPLTNSGNVTFEGSGSLSITDADGEQVAELTMEPASFFLGPGEETELKAEWLDSPFFGKYQAKATVTAVVGPRNPVQFTSETLTLWLIPWVEIITVLILIALVVWALYATRRSRMRWARHRREEKAVLRDYRQRRRLEEKASTTTSGRHRS